MPLEADARQLAEVMEYAQGEIKEILNRRLI
jgi:hypothetical protein